MNWIFTISLLTVIAGLSTIFDNILSEKNVSSIKNKIIDWWISLSEIDFTKIIRTSNLFIVDLFNEIYGRKHLSLKCFYRSAISSVLFLCILLLFFFTFTEYKLILEQESTNYIQWIMIGIIFNVLIDYVSLVETRTILRFSINKSIFVMTILLFVDFCFSILIFTVVVKTSYSLILLFTDPSAFSSYISFNLSYNIIHPILNLDGLTPFTYSSLFTSIAFYLLVIMSFLLKFLSILEMPVVKMLEWLASKKRPFSAIAGLIAGIVLLFDGIKHIFNSF